MSGDDLARVINPAGVLQPMGYRKGTILEWDPVYLRNRVDVGGGVLVDMPVLGVAEAATFKVGSTVGCAVVDNDFAIIGRFVRPATAEAADAVSMLSSRTAAQTINVQESTTSFDWTDLATVGPQVTVTIGPSGRALMFLSAKGGWSLVGANVQQGAFMTAALTGANTQAASLIWVAFIETTHGNTTFSTVSATISSAYTFSGLTPGATTFTAKYGTGVNGLSADFNRRTLVVIAL